MSVKGWCPGAYTPMMSGDGLIVRVRPRLGQLSADQALGLCDIAQRFGNGTIDLTSRANLQIRGVRENVHPAVLDALLSVDLLDATPALETRRNIMVTPYWQVGDLNQQLHNDLCARLTELPVLPAKVGFAIDAAAQPALQDASADFRFETGEDGGLILRLDGMAQGRSVSSDTAMDALLEAAGWFATKSTPTARRMAHTVSVTPPPAEWTTRTPATARVRLRPGKCDGGIAYGVPFGSIDAAALNALIVHSRASALRTTPWRIFVLEAAQPCPDHGFITDPVDFTLRAHACPGAPACKEATVETRALARALAPLHPEGLHVSGCAKGCAHPRPCATTLVGAHGAYDLVKQGHPWDQPSQRGLSPADLLTIKA